MYSSLRLNVVGLLSLMTILWLSVGVQSAEGQGIITGTAEDARSGQPLGSVQISISNLDIGVLSQSNGAYQITNVPAGTHTVTAQRLGYETVEIQVSIAAGQTAVAEFNLTQAALGLDEVIVTGTAGGSQRRAIGNVVERMDGGVNPKAS